MKVNGEFQPGGMVGSPNIDVTGEADQPEQIISLDRIYDIITRGERRRKHIHAVITVLVNSFNKSGVTTGYYSALPVNESKEKFLKVLADLPLKEDSYKEAGDEIQFCNGSVIKFIQAQSCGSFHVVAPTENYFSKGLQTAEPPTMFTQPDPWVEKAKIFALTLSKKWEPKP